MEELIDLESDVLYRVPAEGGETECRYIPGTLPVLISAPHSAVHTREGEDKEEEEYTAALAQFVGNQTGAHVLYLRRRSGVDPSWHRDIPYKQYLASIVRKQRIRFVMDLHGASQKHDFGIALGTMGGVSCPEHRPAILKALQHCGFSDDRGGTAGLDLDDTFKGNGRRGQETVTAFVWRRLHVPVAQFELHERLRVVERREDATLAGPYHADRRDVERAICALTAVVHAVLSV